MELDIDHLRSWIGNEETASEEVTPALVRRFGAAFDLDPGDTPGAAAPALIHLCLCQAAVPGSELGPDGHPTRGGFLPPVPLPRRMAAGGAFSFHGDIRVGETVTRNSRILEVNIKKGRSGTLCFVMVEHRISSGSRHVLTERQDIVYRDAASGAAKVAAAPAAAPAGEHKRTITPTAPLLFRYSALTFNGHRIHYDANYVRELEGYPGLVVHGPLQATMLIHYAEKLRGKRLASFKFRSLATIFDNGDFTLNAIEEEGAMKLWTAQAGGPVAMEATVQW